MRKKRLYQLIDSLATNRKLKTTDIEAKLERELRKLAEELINEGNIED